jgi:integrase
MRERVRLEDGKLVLEDRGGSGIWYARIYLDTERRYVWKSLRTSDLSQAKRDALRLFHQTQFKLAEGLPITQRTLNAVIDEYEHTRDQDNRLGRLAGRSDGVKHTSDAMLRQIRRVARFWREYAGTKPITSVDDKLLAGYVHWRKAYYHGRSELPKNAKLKPTDKTLQWEITLGKMLIKFAHDRGYRGKLPLPTFTFVPKVKRVRPAFSRADFKILCDKLPDYVEASQDKRQRASRALLRYYVLILVLSGLRVGELNNLRIRDIDVITDEDGRPTFQFAVSGKTGKRVVVPRIEAKNVIEAMLLRRSGTPNRDALLFVMPDGSSITTLADQFQAFLKFAGLVHNSAGERHTLYSLRHTYATLAIMDDVDVFTIARNMGTSVQMIEQYYGKHAMPTTRARKLGGEPFLFAKRPKETVKAE